MTQYPVRFRHYRLLNKSLYLVVEKSIYYLGQRFPRLGSLRGCKRAHVLVVRTCKHLASVPPPPSRVEKVRPHESWWYMLSRCVNPTEKNTIKQVNWDNPPCAGFRKRYVGRIFACFKNAIGSLCPICIPKPYNQKGYFTKWKCLRNRVITSWKNIWETSRHKKRDKHVPGLQVR